MASADNMVVGDVVIDTALTQADRKQMEDVGMWAQQLLEAADKTGTEKRQEPAQEATSPRWAGSTQHRGQGLRRQNTFNNTQMTAARTASPRAEKPLPFGPNRFGGGGGAMRAMLKGVLAGGMFVFLFIIYNRELLFHAGAAQTPTPASAGRP
eukprot:TRINITY_DN23088_c0_g1_i1.p2 TRINITY_DN23088_c0_g1~~TRINITY_DN23088_c0_g1_i1.p2  ORF type:complete len:153 (+),score=38.83 TRINITY_DN23088_c0_g1_i1:57-515(+)